MGRDRMVFGFITTYAISGFLGVLWFPPSINFITESGVKDQSPNAYNES